MLPLVKRRKIEKKEGLRGIFDPEIPLWKDILSVVFTFVGDGVLNRLLRTSKTMSELVMERAVFSFLFLQKTKDFKKLGKFYFRGLTVKKKIPEKHVGKLLRQRFLEEVSCSRPLDFTVFTRRSEGRELFPVLKRVGLHGYQLEKFNFLEFLKKFPRRLERFSWDSFVNPIYFTVETLKAFVEYGKFDRIRLSSELFYKGRGEDVCIQHLTSLCARSVLLWPYRLFDCDEYVTNILKQLRMNVRIEELIIDTDILKYGYFGDNCFDLNDPNYRIGVVLKELKTENSLWNLKRLVFSDIDGKDEVTIEVMKELEIINSLKEVKFDYNIIGKREKDSQAFKGKISAELRKYLEMNN